MLAGDPQRLMLGALREGREGSVAILVTISWLFVIFGEHQVMAQLIAKRVLMSPLIHKDFPVLHPLLVRSNFASMNLNRQK